MCCFHIFSLLRMRHNRRKNIKRSPKVLGYVLLLELLLLIRIIYIKLLDFQLYAQNEGRDFTQNENGEQRIT